MTRKSITFIFLSILILLLVVGGVSYWGEKDQNAQPVELPVLNSEPDSQNSSVVSKQTIDIPEGTELLVFDWMIDTGGDGDWVTVHLDSDLQWRMPMDKNLEGILLDAMIDVSEYVGTTRTIYVTLHSKGERNAKFYIGNFELRGH